MFQAEISDILNIKNSKGHIAALFSVKDRVVGPKQSSTDAVLVIDPVTGLECKTPAAIKQATLTYC